MNIFGSNKSNEVRKLAEKVIKGDYSESQDALRELAKLEDCEEAIPCQLPRYSPTRVPSNSPTLGMRV
jgi:hypothetical protein